MKRLCPVEPVRLQNCILTKSLTNSHCLNFKCDPSGSLINWVTKDNSENFEKFHSKNKNLTSLFAAQWFSHAKLSWNKSKGTFSWYQYEKILFTLSFRKNLYSTLFHDIFSVIQLSYKSQHCLQLSLVIHQKTFNQSVINHLIVRIGEYVSNQRWLKMFLKNFERLWRCLTTKIFLSVFSNMKIIFSTLFNIYFKL